MKYYREYNNPNDTELEFAADDNGAVIRMRFTGDEDWDVDEIEYRGHVCDLLSEIRLFLDATGDGIYRSNDNIAMAVNGKYWDDYNNSALYAFEYLLDDLVKGRVNQDDHKGDFHKAPEIS